MSREILPWWYYAGTEPVCDEMAVMVWSHFSYTEDWPWRAEQLWAIREGLVENPELLKERP